MIITVTINQDWNRLLASFTPSTTFAILIKTLFNATINTIGFQRFVALCNIFHQIGYFL